MPNNEGKQKRNSSFEIIRIASTFLIVLCHFASYGDFNYDVNTLSASRFWWFFMEAGGYVGVNVFILISGYYLIMDDQNINVKKILKFWGEVIFYSITIYLLFVIFGIEDFTFKQLIKSIFPIIFEEWWFASSYFVLYLIHPYLNKLLNSLDKNQYQKLLTLLLIIWCVIPTFSQYKLQSNAFIWFVTLYCVAGYIRIFDFDRKYTSKQYIIFLFLFYLLRYLSSVILVILGTRSTFAADHVTIFYNKRSLLTFLSALSLFMAFKNKEVKYNKLINSVASTSFAVYLISDNKYVRPFLWNLVFKNISFQYTALIIPYSLCIVVLIYIVCTFIDLCRQCTFEKWFLSILNKNEEILITLYDKIINLFRVVFFGKKNQKEIVN